MRNQPALVLVVAAALAWAGCGKQDANSEQPEGTTQVDAGPEVDAPQVCLAGCRKLQQCVPELATPVDGDPSVIASRLGDACQPACAEFGNDRAALAVRDCLDLSSCNAYWGCVGSEGARPWLASVAPVGERTCANLCGQASACAIAKLCADDSGETRRRGRGRASRTGAPEAEVDGDDPSLRPGAVGECSNERVRQAELEETCRLRCEATSPDGQARRELIGCIDHGSCGGLLRCIDGWAETDYGDAGSDAPSPGISATCDGFCTRAIVCGAEAENIELEPGDLAELKEQMTSTWVECAVQCEKDQVDDAARERFEACTAVDSCEDFASCSDEV